MGKNPQKEESKKSSKIPPTSSSKPNQPTQKLSEAKRNNPETTPQESKGAAKKAEGNFTIPKNLSQTTTGTNSSSTNPNQRQTQKGDKRARDSSQTSKSSNSSQIKPPPSKKPQTYAEAANPDPTNQAKEPPSLELAWHANQLRIYKGNRYHAPISFHDFVEIRDKLFNHTIEFMRSNPNHKYRTQVLANYYNKNLKCGVFVCKHEQALAWLKEAVTLVSDSTYRGWTNKDEQVTAFVKIFVSQGFENLTPEVYLDANRLIFETKSTAGIPWTFINEYVHHQKQTRIIVAQIPLEVFESIQAKGQETTAGSRVWKVEGFMAPLKITLANAGDMRPSRPQNPKAASDKDRNRSRSQGQSGSREHSVQREQPNTQLAHPATPPKPTSPAPSKSTKSPATNKPATPTSSRSITPPPMSPGSSPLKGAGLNDISIDPFLSNACSNVLDEGIMETADLAMLDSPSHSDTDEMDENDAE